MCYWHKLNHTKSLNGSQPFIVLLLRVLDTNPNLSCVWTACLGLGLRVYFAERPLRTAHLQVLNFTSDRKLNIEQQAGWSNKSWVVVLREIFENLSSSETLERLKLYERPVNDESGQSLEDAKCFFTLCLEVACQRAWSMACHSETQPHLWLGICDPDTGLAGQCKAKIQKDAEVVQAAFQAAANSTGDDLKAKLCQKNIGPAPQL